MGGPLWEGLREFCLVTSLDLEEARGVCLTPQATVMALLFFLYCLILFFFGVSLTYNVALVLGVLQSEPVIHIDLSIFPPYRLLQTIE